ncbi:hypothetical protein HETIRDRAFT_319757 [Heterobasidion irregulare TC 32-1]|uniref:UbiA prenyltransferase n=1 Tax=Heterobasidion irregulare (strain TC 32-1) TaxID=747525 RepID=W4K746_HETIT|nr:uncharacterized protein HETIRDRAFT_319757 [Heterobasidion irregulare TC 32-1]ETW81165.1 hypothetical protein HETIRDRAFT_319757 [Heterobasidion irregulare TC 32-1]
MLSQPTTFIVEALYTAFLFTKSDIKTTVIPITSFAAAAAPLCGLARLPQSVFWIWLHLLQFDVSNQTLSPEEDEVNKQDRPLPSKRITLRNAIFLRWVLIPACWALSAFYSREVLWASMSLVLFTVIYNECSAHAGHWLVRNVVNAAGFASFEAGATLIAGPNSHTLDTTAIIAICCSAGIFATTIHSQDFKDRDGDKAIGRHTIPIVAPAIARYTVVIPLLLWSAFLSNLWQLDVVASCGFLIVALFVGVRFLIFTTIAADQVSFYWYNVSYESRVL